MKELRYWLHKGLKFLKNIPATKHENMVGKNKIKAFPLHGWVGRKDKEILRGQNHY